MLTISSCIHFFNVEIERFLRGITYCSLYRAVFTYLYIIIQVVCLLPFSLIAHYIELYSHATINDLLKGVEEI